MEGWRARLDGSEMRFGSCGSILSVAVFAVHRGGPFLAFRFRFAVRFAAFLQVGTEFWIELQMSNTVPTMD